LARSETGFAAVFNCILGCRIHGRVLVVLEARFWTPVGLGASDGRVNNAPGIFAAAPFLFGRSRNALKVRTAVLALEGSIRVVFANPTAILAHRAFGLFIRLAVSPCAALLDPAREGDRCDRGWPASAPPFASRPAVPAQCIRRERAGRPQGPELGYLGPDIHDARNP
jgi:hypothetical protein